MSRIDIIGQNGGDDFFARELGELLAIIHRDGGYYVENHGWKAAVDKAKWILLPMPEMKSTRDDEIACAVNEITDMTKKYGGTQRMRQEVSNIIKDLLWR